MVEERVINFDPNPAGSARVWAQVLHVETFQHKRVCNMFSHSALLSCGRRLRIMDWCLCPGRITGSVRRSQH